MLTTRPHLSTFRPSPSTVSYTVSTASPRQTFASHFLHYFLLLARILIGLATLLVLFTKAFEPSSPQLTSLSTYLTKYPWVQVGPLAFTALFLVIRRFHTGISSSSSSPPSLFPETQSNAHNTLTILPTPTHPQLTPHFSFPEESLLILRTLGIQTTTLSSSYLMPSDTRFIPTSQIRDIFIHEAFRGFEVRYYLAVIVEGEGEVVVVFPVSGCPFLCVRDGGWGRERGGWRVCRVERFGSTRS